MDHVYVVIWQDHRGDPTATVFADQSTAIDWARSQARENDRDGDLDETLTESMRSAGWLYHGCYSPEDNDTLWVVEREIRR